MADSTATVNKASLPPGFWTIWTTVALDLVGFGIVAPILGRYAERFGASGLEVGLLFASFSLAQFVFSPILGRVSDRVGRKPVIIVSLVGTAVGSFVTGAAGALWVLFLGRIIDGASGASVAVAQSAITDIAPPDQRTKLLGMLGAAFGIGFVLGPAVGGLAALGGPHVPFYVAGTVAAVNAVLAFIRLPETKSTVVTTSSTSRLTTHVVSPELFRFAVVGFIATAGFAGFEATFSLFGERRFNLTEGSAAAVFLFVGALLVVVQGLLVGRLAARVHAFTLLRGALFVVAVGLFTLSTATTWPVLFVSLAVLAFGQGVATPSLTSLVAEAAPAERRGEALGYQQSAGALARIAGPVAAGALFDGVGVGAPYVFGGALVAVALVIMSASRRSKIPVS